MLYEIDHCQSFNILSNSINLFYPTETPRKKLMNLKFTQESIQNVEEVLENEKETFDANKSQKTSSHGTLEVGA